MLMHYAHVAAVPCALTLGGQEHPAMLERYLRAFSTPRCRSSRPCAVDIANVWHRIVLLQGDKPCNALFHVPTIAK